MGDTYGQPVVIKYQLPDEDLDALVSVSCADDLDNMMDEYEKLVERSPDGSAKLRVFLFSASELDSTGMVQFADLHDSGQRYVEPVNGVVDGVGGGIMRKESITSATSTQNSDFSVTEAVDSSGLSQCDIGGPQSTSMLSPRGNLATPHDNSPRYLGVNPNSAIPLGIPVIKSGPLQTSSAEAEVERRVPLNVMQQQQPGMGIPPSTAYMPSYVDPRQEVMNRTDYILPSQMGFPNSQLLGAGGPVFTHQQFRDTASGVPTHQFMPAMHMTMTPSSSLVGIRPTVVQPLVRPQQTRMDRYPEESTYGGRVLQLPPDQSYNAYQPQVPSAIVGGGYGWHPIPPQEHVVFYDGLVPHPQLMIPEKIPRFEDCYMCQKALPHAHSDTLVQDQRDGDVSPASDSNLNYHSLRLEENMRAWPMNRGMATRAMGEGIVEQGAVSRSRVLGHMDHQVGTPQPEAFGFSQNLEAQHENERIIFQKTDNLDHPRTSVPQGLMGLAGDVQSPYGVVMGGIPQAFQENAFQQHLMQTQYQVKQEALVNKPINSDVSPICVLPTQTSEALVHESPREHPGKLPGVPKEDGIDGRMEALQICPDIFANNEQSKSPVDELRNEDIFKRPQQAAGKEVILDTAFSKTQMILDANHNKPMEVPLSSPTEVPHVHNLRPVESFGVAERHNIGHLGPYSPSQAGIRHLDPAETRCGNVAVSGVESAYVMDKIPPMSEWRDDTSRFQPKMVLGDAETFPMNGNMPSSSSPSSRTGDSQDFSNSLFSNQDPWNMRQDAHFLPPRPNKIPPKKETFYTPFGDNSLVNGGELLAEMLLEERVHQPLSTSDKDCNSDHVGSVKGSAEELIKQELQATAEGVAANVLTATPSNPDLPIQKGNESASENNGERGVSSSTEMQNKAEVEDSRNKVPERVNFGFPVSDGIGRLQIIKNSDLEELQELGSGTFGTVYHGKWRGTDVAIKRINDRCFAGKASEQERMRDDFWNEAIKLADLHHPNVVAFYGVVLDGPGGSVATVTEYMVNGSLRTALQRNERNLDKRKRLLIAVDVAFGMEYLHGKNIVHFDLKSDNLLVNLRDPHRPICKVGDLGLSKVKCQTLISGGVRGTLPWMAPELLNGSSSLVSEKVDVFSFGIVLWELLTGEEPYADLHYGAIIGGIVSNTLRPPIPESCDPEWRSLMERCWASEPSERPNFTEIANELRSMAAKIPPKGQAQQQQAPPVQVQK